VPPQDERALAEAIVRYFEEGLAGPMAENVRRVGAGQTFSWQQLVATLEQTARDLGVQV